MQVLAVAGHDDLMQGVVERETCRHTTRDPDLLVWGSLNQVLTSSLDSHPHLRGAHAAALIHVSVFVDFLMQTQT